MPRILVCGTGWGRVHLAAIDAAPARFELAGVLSRWSATSSELAAALRVPHYRAVADVPDDVEFACVAVGGEPGLALADAFLARGVHVLLEHPLHVPEVRACLARAGDRAVVQLNAFRSLLPAPQSFLRHAAARGAPINVLGATHPRTIAAALDLIGRTVGGLEALRIHRVVPVPDPAHPVGAFAVIQAEVPGVPITLLVQRWYAEPDNGRDTLFASHITLGYPDGRLTLGDVDGPLTWAETPRMSGPRTPGWRALPPRALRSAAQERSDLRAAIRVLDEFVQHGRTGRPPAGQESSHLLALCAATDEITSRTGPPLAVDPSQLARAADRRLDTGPRPSRR